MRFLYPSDDDDPRRAARRPLLVFLLITLAVGGLASVFTAPAIPTWYAHINHPAVAPPDWVFPPVWTALYIVMAVAAWRVWRISGTNSREIHAYAVQLLLNFAWAGIFFALHRTGEALGEGLILDLAVLITTILFFRRDRLAGLLFLPYLAWTVFISFLAYGFWRLNG